MPNLEAQAAWVPVREIGIELARGGPNGNMNEQAKALLARTEYLNQEKANKSEIVQGVFEFGTYAEFNAIKSTLPNNCTVVIGEENTTGSGSWGIGNNRWNGSVLSKSSYDPLKKSVEYSDNLSRNNIIKITDVDSADVLKNIYVKENDIFDLYVTNSTSQSPGLIKSLAGTRLHRIPVIAGESYLFSAQNLSDLLGIAFSKDEEIAINKSVNLANVVVVSNNIRKIIVPAGMNYLFFNTRVSTLDVTNSLILNKYSSNFIAYGEAKVTDEKAREDISIINEELNNVIKGSDIIGRTFYPNIANDEITGVYISAVGSSSGVGKFAVYVDSAIQRISVEAGKIYAIYSDNFDNTRFTVTASDSPLTTNGKQNTVLTLSDTSDPKVKTFIVPAAMNFVFMTVYIKSLNFDMRSVIWVNEGTSTSKFDVKEVTVIKDYHIRDELAQQRLDDLNIVQTSVLKNKTWIAIGDSITEKNMRANKNYHDYIKEDVGGMTVFNRGVSGSGFHDRMNVADTLTQQNPDYITIFWGTNDFGLVRNTYPLGTFMNNDENTISGRINTCLNALITKYPLAKIAIISALPRLTNWGSNAAPNSVGYTLKQHVELLEQYANHYSLPFLNLYKNSNLPVWIPAANEYYFTAPGLTSPDGLHPNDAGQRVMADKIKVFLESI